MMEHYCSVGDIITSSAFAALIPISGNQLGFHSPGYNKYTSPSVAVARKHLKELGKDPNTQIDSSRGHAKWLVTEERCLLSSGGGFSYGVVRLNAEGKFDSSSETASFFQGDDKDGFQRLRRRHLKLVKHVVYTQRLRIRTPKERAEARLERHQKIRAHRLGPQPS